MLSQDDYVFSTNKIPKIRGHIDWESPESINFNKFRQDIIDSSKTNDIVIAEGLLVYSDPHTFNLFDKILDLKIPKEVFIKRKILDLRWGREPDWYISHIWESHIKYCSIPKNDNRFMILRGDIKIDIEMLFREIENS